MHSRLDAVRALCASSKRSVRLNLNSQIPFVLSYKAPSDLTFNLEILADCFIKTVFVAYFSYDINLLWLKYGHVRWLI